MSKRDYTEEILSKKSRFYPASTRWENVAAELHRIVTAFDALSLYKDLSDSPEDVFAGLLEEQLGQKPEETAYTDLASGFSRRFPGFWEFDTTLLPIFPVRLVACTESYFRLLYADLLDRGEPFRSNAAKLRLSFLSRRHYLFKANQLLWVSLSLIYCPQITWKTSMAI
jgi:hypothetical protein